LVFVQQENLVGLASAAQQVVLGGSSVHLEEVIASDPQQVVSVRQTEEVVASLFVQQKEEVVAVPFVQKEEAVAVPFVQKEEVSVL